MPVGEWLRAEESTHVTGAAGAKMPGTAPAYYYEAVRPEVARLVPAGALKVLDVGCGAGAMGAFLKQANRARIVVGLEVVEQVARQAEQVLDGVLRVDLNSEQDLGLVPGYFDAIVFGDVLEHLLDPAATLTRLLPYLAPAGVVIASVPNVKHWSLLVPLLLQDRWEYTDQGLLDRTHVHLFTGYEARRMFASVGLTTQVAAQANVVNPPDPVILEPLVKAAAAYGADEERVREELAIFQYLLVFSRG